MSLLSNIWHDYAPVLGTRSSLDPLVSQAAAPSLCHCPCSSSLLSPIGSPSQEVPSVWGLICSLSKSCTLSYMTASLISITSSPRSLAAPDFDSWVPCSITIETLVSAFPCVILGSVTEMQFTHPCFTRHQPMPSPRLDFGGLKKNQTLGTRQMAQQLKLCQVNKRTRVQIPRTGVNSRWAWQLACMLQSWRTEDGEWNPGTSCLVRLRAISKVCVQLRRPVLSK